jgi:hypothetical protein
VCSRELTPRRPPARAPAQAGDYVVGDHCWALDIRNEWCHATVIACAAAKVKVHYTGWSKKWDEWKRVDTSPPQARARLCPPAPSTRAIPALCLPALATAAAATLALAR